MFVQVMKGHTTDAAGIERQNERWNAELRPEADGFLGSTGGVTDDGTFILMACFASRELAEQNSTRPEQASWFRDTAKFFEGQIEFQDCNEVHSFMHSEAGHAGFVQVMQGRILDIGRMLELAPEGEKWMRANRPDYLGSLFAAHDDGRYTDAVYFSSEAEARKGEQAVMATEENAEMMQEWMALFADVEYLDLRNPWIL